MASRISDFDRVARSALSNNGVISFSEAKEKLLPVAERATGATKAAVLRRFDSWAESGQVRDKKAINAIARTVEKLTDDTQTFTSMGIQIIEEVGATGGRSAKSPELRNLEEIAAAYNRLVHPSKGKVEVYSLGKRNRGYVGAALEAAGLPKNAPTGEPRGSDAAAGIDSILSWHTHSASLRPLNARLKALLSGGQFEHPVAASFEIGDRALRRYRPSDNPYPIKMLGFVAKAQSGEAVAIIVSGGG